jgi:hypothetical protein
VRPDAEVLTESLEVLVEVEDVDGSGLGGGGHGEVREREAVGAVGASRSEVAHRREDGPLHGAVDGDLAPALK